MQASSTPSRPAALCSPHFVQHINPDIAMGVNAQVALEKFPRYFETERLVPISIESKYRLDPKKALELADENTISVYVILGSHYEPVKVANLLDECEKRTGPMHSAIILSVAPPLTNLPTSTWRICCAICYPKDFKMPRIVSINSHNFDPNPNTHGP